MFNFKSCIIIYATEENLLFGLLFASKLAVILVYKYVMIIYVYNNSFICHGLYVTATNWRPEGQGWVGDEN